MEKFDSIPALFGRKFIPNREYKAKLVFPKRTPYLCTTKRSHLLHLAHELRKHDDNDEALALLVQRGGCTFERKAKLGTLLPNVKYIIVYDDVKSAYLLPMAGSNTDVSVGMLFVSHASGMELKRKIYSSTPEEGIDVILNAMKPHIRRSFTSGDGAFILRFFFISFVCSLSGVLICFYAAQYYNRIPTFPRWRNQPHLTKEEVIASPEVIYCESFPCAVTERNCSCSICLEDFVAGDKLRLLPCKHLYHLECILPWLTERQSTCPLCKRQCNQSISSVGTSGEESTVSTSIGGDQQSIRDQGSLQPTVEMLRFLPQFIPINLMNLPLLRFPRTSHAEEQIDQRQ